MIEKMACERLLTSFMFVAAVALLIATRVTKLTNYLMYSNIIMMQVIIP